MARWMARRGPTFRFYATLAFLLWSALPHVSLYVHSHARDAHGHAHRAQDADGRRLAGALAAAATRPRGNPAGHPPPEVREVPGAEARVPAPGEPRASASAIRLRATFPDLHAHFQEDANSTLAAWEAPAPGILPPSILPGDPAPAFYARRIRDLRARGPPRGGPCPAA